MEEAAKSLVIYTRNLQRVFMLKRPRPPSSPIAETEALVHQAVRRCPSSYSKSPHHLPYRSQPHGISVRIINLAEDAAQDGKSNNVPGASVSVAFRIDLHWLPHVGGLFQRPRSFIRAPVIFGGLGATYFYEEIRDYPFVIFIVCGESRNPPPANERFNRAAMTRMQHGRNEAGRIT
jgi:hypothetical protein